MAYVGSGGLIEKRKQPLYKGSFDLGGRSLRIKEHGRVGTSPKGGRE